MGTPTLSILIAPVHWGGRTHAIQLLAVACELARRGHSVTYVTSQLQPVHLASLPPNVEVVVADHVLWPEDLDSQLALRSARGEESEMHLRASLLRASCKAAWSFFDDAGVTRLLRRTYDAALVDADSLCGHLLVDALYPLPVAHFLTYPFRRATRQNRLTPEELLVLQREMAPELNRLRARIRAPSKAQCAACHVLTIVGHSRALHAQHGSAYHGKYADISQRQLLKCGPPSIHCVGSVLSAEPLQEMSTELASWADAAQQGFIVVCLGSWGDLVCTRLGQDRMLARALAQLGLPAVWKIDGSRYEVVLRECEAEEQSQLNAAIFTAPWLPQRALIQHRHCALLVTHGGANSISEACAAQVPMVGLSVAWDQPENVAMIGELGVGCGLPLAQCTAETLVGMVRAQLGNAERIRRSTALAASMRSLDTGAGGAADLVERTAALFDREMQAAARAAAEFESQRDRYDQHIADSENSGSEHSGGVIRAETVGSLADWGCDSNSKAHCHDNSAAMPQSLLESRAEPAGECGGCGCKESDAGWGESLD